MPDMGFLKDKLKRERGIGKMFGLWLEGFRGLS